MYFHPYLVLFDNFFAKFCQVVIGRKMVQYLSFIIDHNYVSITLLNFFLKLRTVWKFFPLELQQTFNDE